MIRFEYCSKTIIKKIKGFEKHWLPHLGRWKQQLRLILKGVGMIQKKIYSEKLMVDTMKKELKENYE